MLNGPRYCGFEQDALFCSSSGRNCAYRTREPFRGRYPDWKRRDRVNCLDSELDYFRVL